MSGHVDSSSNVCNSWLQNALRWVLNLHFFVSTPTALALMTLGITGGNLAIPVKTNPPKTALRFGASTGNNDDNSSKISRNISPTTTTRAAAMRATITKPTKNNKREEIRLAHLVPIGRQHSPSRGLEGLHHCPPRFFVSLKKVMAESAKNETKEQRNKITK